ncbi:MAG TPA: hypothetical protein VK927_08035, partial [Adhaeribacter sp.]|nr:hypothetical protein [Adhaeribacter sp.]
MAAKFLTVTVLFWLWAGTVWAQPTQPVRLELEANYYTSSIEIKCLPDSTLLLYERKAGRRTSDLTHYFRRYDSELNQLWIVAAANLPPE